jgi:AcrR family transcriptional regulator
LPTAVKRAERVDAQRNRQKILETADRLLAERGTAVSLGEIATAAGVGAGTVYRHFPSKEALMATVVDMRTEQLTDRGRALRGELPPGAAFFAFLRHVSEQAFANHGICDALSTRGDWREPLKAQGHCMIDSPLANLLRDAQAAGEVRADLDVEDARALMLGFVAMAQSLGSPERAWALTETLLRGLRPDAERNLADRNETSLESIARNETAVTEPACPVCGGPIAPSATGRPAKYCSAACRQKAFRDKRKGA